MQKSISVDILEEEQLLLLKEYTQNIYFLWNEFGLNNEEQVERAKLIWNYLQKTIQGVYEDEKKEGKDLEDLIRQHTEEIEKLCGVLSIAPAEVEGTGLVARANNLYDEVKRLKKIKRHRLKTYQSLRGVEYVYCQFLGAQKYALNSFTGVPSEEDLSRIEQHIQKLNKMQKERYQRFHRARRELSTILEETELTPETSFEKEILTTNDITSLSEETFKSLEDVVSRAQRKKSELEEQRKLLLNKLSDVWDKLCVPDSKRKEFLSKHPDYKVSTIDYIQKEIDVCEKIREDKLKKNIKTRRDELNQLWDKCYVTEFVKNNFTMYHNAEFTEEVLEAHAQEISKWKNYYEKAKSIVSKIEQREKLWDLLLAFEEKITDPNRLKNRGGNLLQEEKERKKLQKELPDLEDSIFRDIDLYESNFGQPFLYYGEDYRNFVTRQWQDRTNEKADERFERLKRHSQELDKEILLQTPSRKPVLRTPKSAPCKVSKINGKAIDYRRLNACSNSHNKLGCGPKVNSAPRDPLCKKLFPAYISNLKPCSASKDVILKELLAASSTSSGASDDKKPNSVLKDINHLLVLPDPSNITTYSEFANELNSPARSDLRSSTFSDKKFVENKSPCVSPSKEEQNLLKAKQKPAKRSSVSPIRSKLGLPFLL